MKIALIGATGFVGSKILDEALQRGHHVTAISRHTDKLPKHANLTVSQADVLDSDQLARLLAGHEVVISSFNPGRGSKAPDIFDQFVAGHRAIIHATKKAGVARFLGVGGAASLKTPSGQEFLDSPDFPKEYEAFKPGIRGTRELYYLLKKEPELDWVFLAPSVRIEPGTRTGTYRTETDQLIKDAKGESRISAEDYAVALLDEIEKPRFLRQRFTAAY